MCSITLGVEAVNPLEMTNAYATLAAHGARRYATPLVELANHNGKPIADVSRKPQQVLDANDADLVTYALEDVVTSGTGTAARLSDRPAAGKTGTAQDYVDAWFCGYTPQLATCVWVGYPQGEIPMESVEGVSPGVRRDDPGRDLARLHDGRDAGATRRVVHHPVVRGPHDRAGDPRVFADPHARRRSRRGPDRPDRPDRHRSHRAHGRHGSHRPDRTHGHGPDGSDRGRGPEHRADGSDQVASVTLS